MIRLLDIIVQIRTFGSGACLGRGWHGWSYLSDERRWICDGCGMVVDDVSKL